MEFRAVARGVHISPRKVRLVADMVRKETVRKALLLLPLVDKRSSSALEKTLRSALASASQKNLSEDTLAIKHIDVFEGQALKRFHPSTRGRVHPYKKRTSHIRVVLEEVKHGTKS